MQELAAATGRAVTLVGVSLGGTTAREVAKAYPAVIARVITLVSPIHLPVATPLAPLAEAAAHLWDMQALGALRAIAEPPPVPLTAMVSRDDGIIDWHASRAGASANGGGRGGFGSAYVDLHQSRSPAHHRRPVG